MACGARQTVKALPESTLPWFALSFATRRAKSLEAARAVLLEAEKCYPEDAMIKFHIACLAAQLGEIAAAKDFLSAALKLNDSLRFKALDEADLAPLWDSLDRQAPGDTRTPPRRNARSPAHPTEVDE